MRKNPFNKRNARQGGITARGFTLLEVLFAFMIMVTGIAILFENQSRSFRMLERGEKIVIASQLARLKLLDCKSELLKDGFSISDFSKEGDFSEEGFKDFTWECRGTRINAPAPSLDALSQNISGPGNETPNGGGGALSTILGPIFSVLAGSLGDSARELSATIRWGKDKQEIRVTTHVIDTAVFAATLSAFPDPKIFLPPTESP